MVIGTVVEGPSDRQVVEAVINRLIPGTHDFRPIQPLETLGGSGRLNGWKGVLKCCEQVARLPGSSIEAFLEFPDRMDLLIIQLDTDAAYEPELLVGLSEPPAIQQLLCPPASTAAKLLRDVCEQWLLRPGKLPPQVIFALPGEEIETWVFAALYPDDNFFVEHNYECRHPKSRRPSYKLSTKSYGKHLKRDGSGEINKHRREYAHLASAVAENWLRVCELCAQAQAFDDALRLASDGR